MISIAILLAATFAVLPGEDLYLGAHAAERAGDHAAAASAFLECAALDGPLAPYATVRAADNAALDGNPDRALEMLRDVLEHHPEGPWVPMAQRQLALALMQQQNHADAEPLFNRALSVKNNLWWLDELRWDQAENRLGLTGSRAQGIDYFRRVVRTSPYPHLLRKAIPYLATSTDTDDQFSVAEALVRSNDLKGAEEVLAGIGPRIKDRDDPLARSLLITARIQLARGNTNEAKRVYNDIAKRFPQIRWARTALMELAGIDIRVENLDAAETLFQRLARAYPASSEEIRTRYRMARNYDSVNRPEPALDHYRYIAEHNRNSSYADDALLNIAHIHRRKGNNPEAIAALASLGDRYPKSTLGAEAAFWLGYLYYKEGNVEAAAKHLGSTSSKSQIDYYAYRARRVMEEMNGDEANADSTMMDTPKALVARLPLDPQPHTDALTQLKDDPRFQRLDFFGRNGLLEAEWEAIPIGLALATDPDPDVQYRAMGEAGVAYTAMQFASARGWGQKKGGGQTISRLQIRHPLAYWETVSALARETNLDPFLILSVARTESTFRPGLTSPAGAKGVMQFMPRTANRLVKNNPGIGPEHAADLMRPANAFRLGAYYLRQLLDEYDGNLVFALAAYNAGPNNLDRWRSRFPTDDLGLFIEDIGYAETRNYVKKILAAYATYHSIYGPPSETAP